jgi:hypothetical protein
MSYTLIKSLYGGSLAGGALASAYCLKTALRGGDSGSPILELSVGAGVAVLILKEVFAYLRVKNEDGHKKMLQEIHNLLIRIDEKLNK